MEVMMMKTTTTRNLHPIHLQQTSSNNYPRKRSLAPVMSISTQTLLPFSIVLQNCLLHHAGIDINGNHILNRRVEMC